MVLGHSSASMDGQAYYANHNIPVGDAMVSNTTSPFATFGVQCHSTKDSPTNLDFSGFIQARDGAALASNPL